MDENRITEEEALRLELLASRRATLTAQAQALAAEEALLHASIKARHGLDDGDTVDVATREIKRTPRPFAAGTGRAGIDPIGEAK